MYADTPITIQFPENPEMPDVKCTWDEFAAQNDEDTAADVWDQLNDGHHYAVIGGGASPLVWVFA